MTARKHVAASLVAGQSDARYSAWKIACSLLVAATPLTRRCTWRTHLVASERTSRVSATDEALLSTNTAVSGGLMALPLASMSAEEITVAESIASWMR